LALFGDGGWHRSSPNSKFGQNLGASAFVVLQGRQHIAYIVQGKIWRAEEYALGSLLHAKLARDGPKWWVHETPQLKVWANLQFSAFFASQDEY